MDRLKQKAMNCVNMAGGQASLAGTLLSKIETPSERDITEARGLLESALANLERARRGFSGVDLDHAFVNELAREIEAEGGLTKPATWGDVVHFALGLSVPRIKRAWNLAMVVLTEEA